MADQLSLFTREELDSSFQRIRFALIEYAAAHTLNELLIRALDEVGTIVDSPIGFYHFVEPDQKTLILQQWSSRTLREFCRVEAKGLHYSVDRAGVWVDCLHRKETVIHNDYASLPHKKGMPEGHAEVKRELVVPVMRKEKVVAILGVGNKPTDYTPRDAEIVSYLADVTWEIVRRKQTEEALEKTTHDLNERVKELNCLYNISKLVEKKRTIDEILQGTADLIPASWQYPGATCARIRVYDRCYRSADFLQTRHELAREIFVHGEKAGAVEVYLRKEKTEVEGKAFLKEERRLLDAVAERMGHIVESRLAEEAIEKKRRELQDAFDLMSKLIQEVIVTGNIDKRFENRHLKKCYEELGCNSRMCPCYGREPMRCWQIAGTFCGGEEQGTHARKYRNCRMCRVFKEAAVDTVSMIGEHFNNMMHILKQKHEELQLALQEIKTLEGIVPICSHCKKIRDDHGFWNRVDSYIEQHTEARFSHGVCPDCQKEYYADFFDRKNTP